MPSNPSLTLSFGRELQFSTGMSASQRLDHFIIAVFGAAGAEKNIKTITLLVFFGAEGAEIFWDERYTTLRRYTTLTVTLVTHSLPARGSGMRNIKCTVPALISLTLRLIRELL